MKKTFAFIGGIWAIGVSVIIFWIFYEVSVISNRHIINPTEGITLPEEISQAKIGDTLLIHYGNPIEVGFYHGGSIGTNEEIRTLK